MHVPRYKCRSLQSVSDHCTYRGIEKNVVVHAKCLGQAEKNYLFDSRSALIEDELEVIYISIHNLGNTPYIFSHNNIYLEQVKYHDISRSMRKTSSISRLACGALVTYPSLPIVAAFSILGVSRIEMLPIMLACCGSLITGGILGGLIVIGIAGSILGLTCLAQGIKSIVMNARISKDLREKTLHENIVIKSGDKYEGLIFVKSSDYSSQFSLTLQEKGNIKNSVLFDVDLHASFVTHD